MSHRDTKLLFKKRRIVEKGSGAGVISWQSERIKELEKAATSYLAHTKAGLKGETDPISWLRAERHLERILGDD